MSKNKKKNNTNSTNANTKPQTDNCCDKACGNKTENCEKFQTYYED